MVNRPSQPEIITVNSEELQTQIRDLLPSQNGFGSELQASNVITPIIDLTAAAEGSGLPTYLQTALAYGSQTTFDVAGSGPETLVSSPGFYRVVGVSTMQTPSVGNNVNKIEIDDGLAAKIIWQMASGNTTNQEIIQIPFDITVFLRAGDSLTVTAAGFAYMYGSHRQVATGDGTLVQPSGYPL